ncbi:MAG: lytic transglycosylase domain-containing protein [Armatimonadetes bacterium]|nr:lytic transglycosylase domain-containing protein [Armatimonadota bacterium]
MKPLKAILILSLVCLFPTVWAQSLDEYVKARRQYGIVSTADVASIDSIVGKRVVEIKGTVKGVVGSGESELLMVEGPGGEQHFVRSNGAPAWLKSGNVAARLIVEAERASENGLLRATLLAAAGESEVADYEAKNKPAKITATVAPRTVRTGGSKSSRTKGRPAPLAGDIPNVVTNPVSSPAPGVSAELAKVVPTYAAFAKKRNPKLSDAQAEKIAESILAYSAHFGVDARLIVAIVITESDFDPQERSHAGAMGLGQLMPVNKKELGLTDAYDIEQNLWGTVKLVRGHIDKYSKQTEDSFEALVLALAGYNAGDGAVKKYNGVPPYRETQNYVRKVIGYYRQLCGN